MMMRELISTYQKSRGLSVLELAKEVGVQHQAIRRFLHGLPLSERHWSELTNWMFNGTPKESPPGRGRDA